MPRLEDLIDKLHSAKIFSKIGLKSGYQPTTRSILDCEMNGR